MGYPDSNEYYRKTLLRKIAHVWCKWNVPGAKGSEWILIAIEGDSQKLLGLQRELEEIEKALSD